MHAYVYIYMYTYIPVDILRRTWAARFSNRILGEVLSLLYIYIYRCLLLFEHRAKGHRPPDSETSHRGPLETAENLLLVAMPFVTSSDARS